MKLITNKDHVIIAIGTTLTNNTDEENVIWLDNAGYALFGQQLHDVDTIPELVAPEIYKYENNEFLPYTSQIDSIRQLAVDEYTLQLIEEGLL